MGCVYILLDVKLVWVIFSVIQLRLRYANKIIFGFMLYIRGRMFLH